MSYAISANGINPEEAFGCMITDRSINPPKRKTVMATVPYMDGYHDFSELGGRACYESREIAYTFSLTGSDQTEVGERIAALQEWLYGISGSELSDEIYPGYHWLGSVTDISIRWPGVGFTDVTAKLTCYPFRIANVETTAELAVGENAVFNPGRRVLVTGFTEGASTVACGAVSQSFTGEMELEIALEHGENTVTVAGSACTIKWREERI